MRRIRIALLFSVLLLAATSNLFAQTMVTGTVADSLRHPVSGCNVLLLSSRDSSLIKGTVSSNDGTFQLDAIAKGSYLLAISFTGYIMQHIPVTITGESKKETGTIVLISMPAELGTVTVVSRKPLLEQKTDRLVINVSNSITSAGSTALEVLEKSPGIIVDHQNNTIAMNGKGGVRIMMNGRISYMPVSSIVQLLSGMPSGNIEKIELITTPPANLDAEGNAGYINIVLKENNNYGTNGSFSTTLGYSRGLITQASLNMNHRKGNINIYGDVSFSRIRGPFAAEGYNKISNDGDITETFLIADRTNTVPTIDGRIGLDWQAGKRTIFAVLFSGNNNRFSQTENNTSRIAINGSTDTIIQHHNSEVNHWYNYTGNINLQHDFAEGRRLTINVDHLHYQNDQPVNYLSRYYDKNNVFVYDRMFRSEKKTPINTWVGAADYAQKLNAKLNMEAGIKQVFSFFNNDVSFENFLQNIWVKDNDLSAKYKLDENYSAAYASFSMVISATTEAKAGLRYEYTNSQLSTETVKNIVDRHYGRLFPSFFISQKLNDNNSINFSYSRRITRPTFDDLAPFTYYVNANTSLTGNPALQPAISNTVKADYTYKSYLLSLSFTQEDDAISVFQPHVDSVKNKSILSAENVGRLKTANVVIALPFNVTGWWSMQYNITATWQKVEASFKGASQNVSQSNVNINASQRFKLPKDFGIELSGFYQSASLYGVYKMLPFGRLDVGIRKKLKEKWGTLVFNATNILNTQYVKFKNDYPSQNLVGYIYLYFERPGFKLTYTRPFGNDKLKEKRERSTSAEDEKNRKQ